MNDSSVFRLLHISDLHLPLPMRPSPIDLANKRVLGYANLIFKRGHTHKREVFEALLEEAVSRAPDLVAITGDLCNLCLKPEYEEVRRIFSRAGLAPERTVIIPGNHDRYTAMGDLFGTFEHEMSSWLPPGFDKDWGYPIVLERGPISLAALDTGVWRGPIRAAGKVDPEQREALRRFLDKTSKSGKWPVIALHHPPYKIRGPLFKQYRAGLAGHEDLMAAVGDTPVTIIHGHMHRALYERIGNAEIFGVPSASNDTGEDATQAAFNVYELTSKGLERAYAVRMRPGRQAEEVALDRDPSPR